MTSSYFNLQLSATVFEALGLVVTAWRIYFRLRVGRFWWEDACAAMLLPVGLCWTISYWIYLFVADVQVSIVCSWVVTMSFTSIVTLARLSILFSVIRLIHGNPRLLVFTHTCAIFFVACWAILVAMKTWRCISDPSWHQEMATPQKSFCSIDRTTSVFEFTTQCISVLILVVLPLRMLWRVKLPTRQRRMILSIFASSVVLSLAAVFHTVGQILNTFMAMIGFHAEAALSIILCNLLVVVTYALRRRMVNSGTAEAAEESGDDDFTEPLPSVPRFALTTVDLDVPTSGVRSTDVMGAV